jgi:glycerophosphoryl diester phosphodiesterase
VIWLRRIAFFGALAALILTFVNASWLSENPKGHLRLIVNGGISQQYSAAAAGAPCPAKAILAPIHDYIEDTARSVQMARRMGADLVALDVARTADDAVVLYPDAALDCRSNGTGLVSAMPLAQVQRLDPGYGYSADGGKTFPLRGDARNTIPTIEQVIEADPRGRYFYRFVADDAAAATSLVSRIKALGRDPVASGDGFSGGPAAIAVIRAAWPKVWAFDPAQAAACTSSYRLSGWTSQLPAACKGGTMIAALDSTFTLWGWPNRTVNRMAETGGQIIAVRSGTGQGLRHARDLPSVPVTFRGYVLVDDYWTVGPALRPGLDKRTNAQALAAQDRDDTSTD